MNKGSIGYWIASLQRELVEMDQQSSVAQVEAWKKFHLQDEFPQIEHNYFEGYYDEAYLDWKVIKLELYLKERRSFWYYFTYCFRRIFGAEKEVDPAQIEYVLCRSTNRRALQLKVSFSKEDGQIKAESEVVKE